MKTKLLIIIIALLFVGCNIKEKIVDYNTVGTQVETKIVTVDVVATDTSTQSVAVLQNSEMVDTSVTEVYKTVLSEPDSLGTQYVLEHIYTKVKNGIFTITSLDSFAVSAKKTTVELDLVDSSRLTVIDSVSYKEHVSETASGGVRQYMLLVCLILVIVGILILRRFLPSK